MEKLLNLLNEYEGTLAPNEQIEWTENGVKATPLIVISNGYGFIKWLVENEKIDLGKIKKLYRKSNEHSIHTYPIMYEYSDYESLLMLLAIQNEPIEFLVSILK